MTAWTDLPEEDGHRRLAVEVPWEEIAGDYEDLVARAASSATIPGFRPGRAPREAVERFCRAGILAELEGRAVQRLGSRVVREAGLDPAGPVEASDVVCRPGEPFRAVVRCVPVPAFEVPDLADLGPVGIEPGEDPRDALARRLLDRVPFEAPAPLVRAELARSGQDAEPPGSEAWRAAAERVRLLLVLKRIARRDGIEVDAGDVERRIEEKAAAFGATPQALRADLQRHGGTDRLRDMLLAERTLDYLLTAR